MKRLLSSVCLLTCLLTSVLLLFPVTATAHSPQDPPISKKGDTTMDLTYDYRLSDEGTAYYISSSLGNDQNDGKSEDSPWKSFANLYRMDLTPGDRVLLRRGDVWHERLTIRGKGRADAWIFVGTYGDTASPKPEISLQNGRDDIAILATDISVGAKNGFGLDYIWIDNIHVSHSFLGIYFRYDTSKDNKGIRVTNCSFTDINCPDLMAEAMTDVSFLHKKKGKLEDYRKGQLIQGGGGEVEYIWPTAINIGGRPAKPLADVVVEGIAEPATVVSDIELYQNDFRDCVIAVGANCYNYHYGTGPNQCYTYTTNWNVRGLTTENTMSAISIDSADFGYDGTPESRWGRWSHIQAKGGMEDFTMSFGTTQALFSCCRNLYISHSSFNGSRNNGQADGCGFDFERSVHNFTLDSCIIANNEGQGILVMQTTMENQVTGQQIYTPNTGNTIQNCLFYNNMTSVHNDNYRFDVTIFNPNNENFTLRNNTFYFREKTAGKAEVFINFINRKLLRPFGPERNGFTEEGSVLVRNNDLPPLTDVLNELGMTESVMEYPPVDKIWYNYTDEGASLPETEGSTVTSAPPSSTSPESTEDKGGNPSSGCASALPCAAGITAAALSGAALTVGRKKKSDPTK